MVIKMFGKEISCSCNSERRILMEMSAVITDANLCIHERGFLELMEFGIELEVYLLALLSWIMKIYTNTHTQSLSMKSVFWSTKTHWLLLFALAIWSILSKKTETGTSVAIAWGTPLHSALTSRKWKNSGKRKPRKNSSIWIKLNRSVSMEFFPWIFPQKKNQNLAIWH